VAVKDNEGKTISNLAVVPLGDDEINSPGANKGAATGSGSSSTGTSSSSSASASSSKNAAAGMGPAHADWMAWTMVSAVTASFLVGLLA
jgi:1,3-beta-glucanosyltransferase GAS3